MNNAEEYYKTEDSKDESYDWDKEEIETALRKRKHKQVCIFCKSSEKTVISNSKTNQFYCKKCNKYFKPNSKRKKYSNKEKLIYNVIYSLFRSHSQDSMSLKKFLKKINQKNTKKFENCNIKFQALTEQIDLDHFTITKINDAMNVNSIIITKTDEGFSVIRGLDKYHRIFFLDNVVTIQGIK